MVKLLTSRLEPSFLQHNLRLVVSGHCSLVVVMKCQDKFASLQQYYLKQPQWLRKVLNM